MRNRQFTPLTSQFLRKVTLRLSSIEKHEYLRINSKSDEVVNSVLHRAVPTNLPGMFLLIICRIEYHQLYEEYQLN